MKKLLLLFTLLSTMIVSAQEGKYTRDYYLTKSKNQKTMGWIMLAGGAGLVIAGIAVGNSDNNNDPNELDFGPNFDAGLWLLGGGLAVGAGSIPFFISSSNNARKAASISIINQKILIPKGAALSARTQPAISIRIAL
jgi:hypothetical protein